MSLEKINWNGGGFLAKYVALLYMKRQEKRESAWSLKNENFISLRLS